MKIEKDINEAANWIPPDIDVWDAENIFYLKSHESRLGKLLALYEIYKKIIDIPGDIVECGVYKGASLMRLAAFRRLLENDYSREIFGFDIFGTFPTGEVSDEADLKFIKEFESGGGNGISACELQDLFKRKSYRNISLVQGNLFETLPEYMNNNSHRRIALLHLDLDVYEPTKYSLECLADSVVPGGVIVFDDYSAVDGATKAADEFLKRKNYKINKVNYYKVPSYVCI